MQLKSLELQGFKSFPDKTKINFGRGLTAVVGPNGSGKSNISDAIRWVLGEQSNKSLRSEKLEDVVFKGTQKRKAQGFAEVSLTIDNSDREFLVDSDEITITRRYDRSGESEYMINRSAVKLKDIREMLLDTGLGKDGYAVVGQGRIAEIVESKPTDRREIFEEAAGIAKYRYRKTEAERSLSNAEENLSRLRDILSELESRVGPLLEQSNKAKRFISLSEEKKGLEVSLWIDTIEKNAIKLKELSEQVMIAQNHLGDAEGAIEELEQKAERTFKEIQNCNIEIDNIRRQKEEHSQKVAEASAQIAVSKNDIQHNEQNIERLKNELLNHDLETKGAESLIAELNGKIAETEEFIKSLESDISKKQEQLISFMSESESFTKQEKDLQEKISNRLLLQTQAKTLIASSKINLAELKSTIASNENDIKLKAEEIKSLESEEESLKSFSDELDIREEGLKNTYNGHKMKLDNRLEKLKKLNEECQSVDLMIKEKEQKAKLLSNMEQSLDGFAQSVKEVMKKAKNGVLRGTHGTVSQLISVDAEYSVAVETALGMAMQNIVVDDEASAKAAIRMLKQDNLGRATFLPLTSVKGNVLSVPGIERYAGFVDMAVNLVRFDSKYEPVMNSLLGRIAIVEDIDTAVLIAQKNGYKFKLVTLDGQVVNAGGSLTGGSRNKGQSFLSRKNDIQKLNSEVKKLSETLGAKKASVLSLNDEISKIEAEYKAVLSEITTINEDRIRVGGEMKRVGQMLLSAKQLHSQMEAEIAQKTQKIAEYEALEKSKEGELIALSDEIDRANEDLSHLLKNSQSVTLNKTEIADEISALKIKAIEYGKDVEALNASLEAQKEKSLTVGGKTKEIESEIKEIEENNKAIAESILALETLVENSRGVYDGFNAEIETVSNRRNAMEGESNDIRRQSNELTANREKLNSEITRLGEKEEQLKGEYDGIINMLLDEYDLTKSEAQGMAVRLDDVRKAQSELNSIKNKIRALGSVNVEAIEEYKEVSARYEYLKVQVGDAEKSRDELLTLISELTEKMQDIFLQNFNTINENFKRIFSELFGGGNAKLILTDPQNLLETGIEIDAELPGKIKQSLSGLSGGERSLIAISIYFAILRFRPAPFCVLDEIEAALDDVNVDKYAKYLASLYDSTQFITITHRRGTMEAADVLYGVTMQEKGVSKLLELNVSEIESKLEMDGVK